MGRRFAKRTQQRLLDIFGIPANCGLHVSSGRTVVVTGHILLPFLLYNALRLSTTPETRIYVSVCVFIAPD